MTFSFPALDMVHWNMAVTVILMDQVVRLPEEMFMAHHVIQQLTLMLLTRMPTGIILQAFGPLIILEMT